MIRLPSDPMIQIPRRNFTRWAGPRHLNTPPPRISGMAIGAWLLLSVSTMTMIREYHLQKNESKEL